MTTTSIANDLLQHLITFQFTNSYPKGTVIDDLNYILSGDALITATSLVNNINDISLFYRKGSSNKLLKTYPENHDPKEIKKAFKLLIKYGRLAQLGPGIGKAFILLSEDKLGVDEVGAEGLEPNDLITTFKDYVETLISENDNLRDKVEDLEVKNKQLEDRIISSGVSGWN